MDGLYEHHVSLNFVLRKAKSLTFVKSKLISPYYLNSPASEIHVFHMQGWLARRAAEEL